MLEVENVTFSYSDKSHPVFKDISLSLQKAISMDCWARMGWANRRFFI
jgi:ABC-type multidrug transport system fused ATPase/permease subunit